MSHLRIRRIFFHMWEQQEERGANQRNIARIFSGEAENANPLAKRCSLFAIFRFPQMKKRSHSIANIACHFQISPPGCRPAF